MPGHEESVTLIAAQVQLFHKCNKPFRIYHGPTNSTRPFKYGDDSMIDTSKLSNVLRVDIDTRTALVEPNVSMDRLVKTTLQYGLIPPVVMEFPGITAGGGFSGTSGESSSFKHGLFEQTVNRIEMVLANGDVVNASGTENAELFYGAASSFGTLGVTTLLDLRLIEAKTYVELTYHPVANISEAVQKIEEATKDTTNDYLDGILFARDHGVICTGRLTNVLKEGVRIQRFSRRKDPWFYLHAKKIIKQQHNTPFTEAVPLVDYLFRYDRGGFWVGTFAFKYFLTPFNSLTRWALDQFLQTRFMYHALHESGLSQRYIVQDFGIPYSAAEKFVERLDCDFKFYPLWLCPIKQIAQMEHSTFSHFGVKGEPDAPEMLLNFGFWGEGSSDLAKFVDANRRLEAIVQGFNGKKWLYAHTYYTESEFWKIYSKEKYDTLRAKYHATYLPSVYEKVKVDLTGGKGHMTWTARLLNLFWTIWPLRGLYGLFHAAFGGDYLLRRKVNRK